MSEKRIVYGFPSRYGKSLCLERLVRKRFRVRFEQEDGRGEIVNEKGVELTAREVVDLLNEQDKEIDLLRLELDTHKHPLWSTREAERKVNKLADSLANEVKKNGLLNEEINQLRIENMRLKKKGGDSI